MQSSDKWSDKDTDAREMQDSLIKPHEQTLNAVCAIIEADILDDGNMMKLSPLNDAYKSSLLNTSLFLGLLFGVTLEEDSDGKG